MRASQRAPRSPPPRNRRKPRVARNPPHGVHGGGLVQHVEVAERVAARLASSSTSSRRTLRGRAPDARRTTPRRAAAAGDCCRARRRRWRQRTNDRAAVCSSSSSSHRRRGDDAHGRRGSTARGLLLPLLRHRLLRPQRRAHARLLVQVVKVERIVARLCHCVASVRRREARARSALSPGVCKWQTLNFNRLVCFWPQRALQCSA